MGKCIIFCAGEFDSLVQAIETDDCVIAADGGLHHTDALGLTPQIILGDFDSLGYTPTGSRVYPVEKDDTDAMLAVRQGLKLGYRDFLIYGGMDGPRLDHTIANFQTLQFLADRDARGFLVGKHYLAGVLKNSSWRFSPQASGIFSVFCLGPDARGVTIRGAKYSLENGTIHSGFPLGVSNHFTGNGAEISVESGSLLILWDRENGFPQF